MGRTVLIGSAGDGGYRQLTAGPGEPHIVRSDIIGATFTTLTYALTAFAQMTDLHIVDDQSPLRVEFLDRYANAGPSHYASYPTSAAYRAHESLSTQVVDAMCQLCDNECVTRTGAFFDRSDQRNVKSDRAAAHREAINAY